MRVTCLCQQGVNQGLEGVHGAGMALFATNAPSALYLHSRSEHAVETLVCPAAILPAQSKQRHTF
jgi:hypothetical protein